mmetsp:Transcript_65064/g.121224  ORF Transcript_65064/g.121224 Transcript_65064/m.121224 type:complete len:445 (+) Transcript_65064:74-1408(+)
MSSKSKSSWMSCCHRRLGCRRCPISGEAGSCPFSSKVLASKSQASDSLLGRAPQGLKPAAANAAKNMTKVEKLLRRGSELLLNHEFVYAEMSFSKAIEIDALDWRGHYGKAIALYGQGRDDAAYAHCKDVPTEPALHASLLSLKELLSINAGGAEEQKSDVHKAKHVDSEAESEAESTAPAETACSPRGDSEASADTSSREILHAAKASNAQANLPNCPGETAVQKAASAGGASTSGELDKTDQKWDGCPISARDRETAKLLMLTVFREQWERIGKQKATMGYNFNSDESKLGLKITGGHRPLERPQSVELPAAYRQWVGTLTSEQLLAYGCDSSRLLLSLYGDIFDVSDRPDKYGKDGPYHYLTGHDITWGLVSGQDTEETVNLFYDLFKSDESSRQKKLQCICSWIAFYETEYGKAVGRLAEYEAESELPPPPEIGEQCVVQ